MTQPFIPPESVLVTGAGGNIGRKLIDWLARTGWCRSITGLDVTTDLPPFPAPAAAKLKLVAGDLSKPDPAWEDAFAGIDAVIHLAAQNPNVDATWTDAAVSFDMVLNVTEAARRAGVRRLVFASSNHVMGGY